MNLTVTSHSASTEQMSCRPQKRLAVAVLLPYPPLPMLSSFCSPLINCSSPFSALVRAYWISSYHYGLPCAPLPHHNKREPVYRPEILGGLSVPFPPLSFDLRRKIYQARTSNQFLHKRKRIFDTYDPRAAFLETLERMETNGHPPPIGEGDISDHHVFSLLSFRSPFRGETCRQAEYVVSVRQ